MPSLAHSEKEEELHKKRRAGDEALRLLEKDVIESVANIEQHLQESCLNRFPREAS